MNEDDLVLIPGDICWAMKIEDAYIRNDETNEDDRTFALIVCRYASGAGACECEEMSLQHNV